LDGESKRLLEKEWKSYVRNGLGIEKGPKRDRFKEIKKRLSQVCWDVPVGAGGIRG
jgi:metallopeptidase MepB